MPTYRLRMSVYDADDIDSERLAEAVKAAVDYSTAREALETALENVSEGWAEVGLELVEEEV